MGFIGSHEVTVVQAKMNIDNGQDMRTPGETLTVLRKQSEAFAKPESGCGGGYLPPKKRIELQKAKLQMSIGQAGMLRPRRHSGPTEKTWHARP